MNNERFDTGKMPSGAIHTERPDEPVLLGPPPLDSKESRTAMTKCLNALDDLTDDQRTRVVRAVAILYGIKIS